MEPYDPERSEGELGGVGWGLSAPRCAKLTAPTPTPPLKEEGLIVAYPFFLAAGFFAGVAGGAL